MSVARRSSAAKYATGFFISDAATCFTFFFLQLLHLLPLPSSACFSLLLFFLSLFFFLYLFSGFSMRRNHSGVEIYKCASVRVCVCVRGCVCVCADRWFENPVLLIWCSCCFCRCRRSFALQVPRVGLNPLRQAMDLCLRFCLHLPSLTPQPRP